METLPRSASSKISIRSVTGGADIMAPGQAPSGNSPARRLSLLEAVGRHTHGKEGRTQRPSTL